MDGTYLSLLGVVLLWSIVMSALLPHGSLSDDIGKLRDQVNRLRAEIRRRPRRRRA